MYVFFPRRTKNNNSSAFDATGAVDLRDATAYEVAFAGDGARKSVRTFAWRPATAKVARRDGALRTGRT